jgi:hypothetical protein
MEMNIWPSGCSVRLKSIIGIYKLGKGYSKFGEIIVTGIGVFIKFNTGV